MDNHRKYQPTIEQLAKAVNGIIDTCTEMDIAGYFVAGREVLALGVVGRCGTVCVSSSDQPCH